MSAISKPVKREVNLKGWRNPLIVTIHPNGVLELREKRTPRSYFANLEGIYARACMGVKEK